MASGHDEWAAWSAHLKREGKKNAKLVQDSWRAKLSSAIKIPSSSDTQDAASIAESTLGQGSVSHANAAFQYDPLPGEGLIRLLTILPGDDEEAIQLQLSTGVLDDSFGSYESLSYVWFVWPRAPLLDFTHHSLEKGSIWATWPGKLPAAYNLWMLRLPEWAHG